MQQSLQTQNKDQLYQFDGTQLTPYGDTFDVSIGGMANAPEDVRFAVNPVDGQIVVFKHDDDNYVMYSFMDENLRWGDFTYVGTSSKSVGEDGAEVTTHDVPACYGGSFSVHYDTKGNLLVIWPDDTRKTGFHLYTICLEDDILPE